VTDINWTSSADGDWNVAANWSTDSVPTSSGDVTIAAPGAYTVTISSGDEADSLLFDAPGAMLVENAGSLNMAGPLLVDAGFVALNEANPIGGVVAEGGVLAFSNPGALGTDGYSVAGGELLATTNETLDDGFDFSANSTIAAAHGTTLNENANVSVAHGGATLNIGSPGEDGTILWHNNDLLVSGAFSLHVQDGTLKAADNQFSALTQAPTTLDAGATVDIAGFDTTIGNLTGGGKVIDSGAAATLTLDAANFSGSISGPLSVDFDADASLSSLEDYTGNATLSGTASVTNSGTYDLVGNSAVDGASSTSFINNNVFEKTGGGGVSDVTSNFVNNGALNVLSGRIEFSGGFTNNGLVHGLVTRAKITLKGHSPEVTVSAPVPSDFNGDTLSDVLWQNASGQASIWDMSGNALTGGGTVSPNPGAAWKAIGTGDFNGDGHADILWQNSDGQASIWEMNGNTLVGGGAVSPNPGPAWQAIGTGDFNGDGFSGILFQNTASGQVSIWEMNGNSLIGGGSVSPNPGPAWQAIGTGDFNDDGRSDILFQNTSSGQVSIWEMNGNTLIGGGPVGLNPGPGWRAIGTGDFNGDGHSDILFQNTNGQAMIWEMNGTNVIGGGPVSPNPGANWRAIA
jgi:hypothetical protein